MNRVPLLFLATSDIVPLISDLYSFNYARTGILFYNLQDNFKSSIYGQYIILDRIDNDVNINDV